MIYFFDASFLIALFNSDDTFYQNAVKTIQKINLSLPRYITSNIALAETVNLLFRTKGTLSTKKFLSTFYKKSNIEEYFVSKETFASAYKLLFQQKSKSGLNFFDCLHLATMKELGIENILTFDKEFKKWVKVVDV